MPGRSRKKASGPTPKGVTDAKKKGESPSPENRPAASSNALRSLGLPAPESVVGETQFTSPKGFKYRIIHTSEVDLSDEPQSPSTGRRKKAGGRGKKN
jgi:hypothetical protein